MSKWRQGWMGWIWIHIVLKSDYTSNFKKTCIHNLVSRSLDWSLTMFEQNTSINWIQKISYPMRRKISKQKNWVKLLFHKVFRNLCFEFSLISFCIISYLVSSRIVFQDDQIIINPFIRLDGKDHSVTLSALTKGSFSCKRLLQLNNIDFLCYTNRFLGSCFRFWPSPGLFLFIGSGIFLTPTKMLSYPM